MFKLARISRLLLCFLLITAAVPALAEDETIIEVITDVPCAIFIDDIVIGRAIPYVPMKIEVEGGYHDIIAYSLQVADVQWEDSIRIDEGDTEELEVELNDRVEESLWDQDERYQRESKLENQADGTLKDPDTGLLWTLLDNNFDIDWDSSQRYCSTLMLAREIDEPAWRIPTLDELKTIVDEDYWDGFKILGQVRLSGCCVWSSEEHGNTSAWYFDYEVGERGFVTKDYPEGGRVLCVR